MIITYELKNQPNLVSTDVKDMMMMMMIMISSHTCTEKVTTVFDCVRQKSDFIQTMVTGTNRDCIYCLGSFVFEAIEPTKSNHIIIDVWGINDLTNILPLQGKI